MIKKRLILLSIILFEIIAAVVVTQFVKETGYAILDLIIFVLAVTPINILLDDFKEDKILPRNISLPIKIFSWWFLLFCILKIVGGIALMAK